MVSLLRNQDYDRFVYSSQYMLAMFALNVREVPVKIYASLQWRTSLTPNTATTDCILAITVNLFHTETVDVFAHKLHVLRKNPALALPLEGVHLVWTFPFSVLFGILVPRKYYLLSLILRLNCGV